MESKAGLASALIVALCPVPCALAFVQLIVTTPPPPPLPTGLPCLPILHTWIPWPLLAMVLGSAEEEDSRMPVMCKVWFVMRNVWLAMCNAYGLLCVHVQARCSDLT